MKKKKKSRTPVLSPDEAEGNVDYEVDEEVEKQDENEEEEDDEDEEEEEEDSGKGDDTQLTREEQGCSPPPSWRRDHEAEAMSIASDGLAELTSSEFVELVYKEEAQQRILAIRENLTPVEWSPASVAFQMTLVPVNRQVEATSTATPKRNVSEPFPPLSTKQSIPFSLSPTATSSATVTPASLATSSAPIVSSVQQATSNNRSVPLTEAASRIAAPAEKSTATPSVAVEAVMQNSVNPSVSVAPTAVARTYVNTATNVSVSNADLRGFNRLTGEPNENPQEALTHYRMIVGLKASAVSPDPAFADSIALKHVALVGSGEVLTLIQQILSGQINCDNAADSPDPETPGSHPAPTSWKQMEKVLLHFLLAANSIEEGATAIATIQQGVNESVGSYALRFRTILSRFLAAVERAPGNRTPYNCLTTELWQLGLLPSIRSLHFQTDPPQSLKAAVDLARRIESTGVTGSTVSALSGSSPTPQNPSSSQKQQAQVNTSKQANRVVTWGNGLNHSNTSGARASGGGSGSRGAGAGDNGARAPRDRRKSNARAFGSGNGKNSREFKPCTYEGCKSRNSHPLERCWAKDRDDNPKSQKKKGQSGKRSRKKSNSDSE